MYLETPFGGYIKLETSNKTVYLVKSLWVTEHTPGVMQVETITKGSPVFGVPFDDITSITLVKKDKE